MPLSDAHTKTVGFIVGNGETVGTFFVIQKSGICFMVTAAHNLVAYNDSRARIRTHQGDVLYEWDPGAWYYPDLDGRLDLAVNCFDPAADDEMMFTAVPIDEQGVDVLHAAPKLGTTVYFAGLLTPVESMGEDGVPMVRTGTLGALYQRRVSYENGDWGPFTAHLIDTRSWGGFSGAPVWSQLTYPGPALTPKPERLMADVPPHVQLGDLHFITTFLGMFVGHARTSGAGVVLPVETIREVLEREEVLEMCADRGHCGPDNRREVDQDDEIRADTSLYQREDFLSDLRKVTKRRDRSDEEPKEHRSSRVDGCSGTRTR